MKTDMAPDTDKLLIGVKEALIESFGPIKGAKRAVMFSGGFDSLLLVLLARQAGAVVTAVTIQFEDYNLATINGAVELARQTQIPHHVLYVRLAEFLSAFEKVSALTDEPVLDLDLAVVYAALSTYNPAIGGNVFISGMGADQWFGDLKDEGKRIMMSTMAHQQAAQIHDCAFCFPFASPGMQALSEAVPTELKKEKKLLRLLAQANNIPTQGIKSQEHQVPDWTRNLLIERYGHRAWPCAVSVQDNSNRWELLRQIVQGIRREKRDESDSLTRRK